jgi:hypothetical protein
MFVIENNVVKIKIETGGGGCNIIKYRNVTMTILQKLKVIYIYKLQLNSYATLPLQSVPTESLQTTKKRKRSVLF